MIAYVSNYSIKVDTIQKVKSLPLQSNEVRHSNNMELEGLVRSLKFIEDAGVKIHTFITDRHLQVNKYLREKKSGITHYYDVWHVAKGISL